VHIKDISERDYGGSRVFFEGERCILKTSLKETMADLVSFLKENGAY